MIPFDPEIADRLKKPPRGEFWLEGRERRAREKAQEDKAIRDAKVRDGHACRIPFCEHMPKKPRLEGSHFEQHRGMGGNPVGDRTARELILTTCFIHHAEIDHGDLEAIAQTDAKADGPCDYARKNPETGRMEVFASETTIGVSEMRGQ